MITRITGAMLSVIELSIRVANSITLKDVLGFNLVVLRDVINILSVAGLHSWLRLNLGLKWIIELVKILILRRP